MTRSDTTIQVSNFSKSFGRVRVIDTLSFEVERGEILAFLGANGSGKTTTIRCLLNIYKADKGTLKIFSSNYDYSMASRVGYLPEERGLYLTSNVIDTMIYFGELKGLTKEEARTRSLEFLERVGLVDKQQEEIKKLSSGQQQKIQLGITVINRPELLILDEPTKGLDPLNRQLLMDLLYDLNDRGSTILFSTHQMDEAERIADKVLMLKDGKRYLYGAVDKVKAEFGENTIQLRFSGKFVPNADLFTFKQEKNTAELNPNDGIEPDQILDYLLKTGIKITRFEVTTPSLNEIFVNVSNSSLDSKENA